jgi:peptidoglycan biosynthesis protein MviN/MurJ (putative lipid II flippase)
MIAATSIPLVLNIVWSPLVDTITNNKYGEVNKLNFLLLSLCLPFQYMNNLLWTVEFAQNRLRRIFRITAVTCTIIVAGNLLMIPLLNARGAAIVYLAATVTEYFIYMRISVISKIKESWQALFFCTTSMMLSGFAGDLIADTALIRLLLSVTIYCVLVLVTGQVKKDDLQLMKNWLYKKQPAYVNHAIVQR